MEASSKFYFDLIIKFAFSLFSSNSFADVKYASDFLKNS